VMGALLVGACGTGHALPAVPPYIQATGPTLPDDAGPMVDVYAHTRPGDISPAVAGVASRVYVPNSESNTVDVIDPATFEVVDHYAVGRHPQHVTPSWDLTTLYADNDEGNTLTPIDPHS